MKEPVALMLARWPVVAAVASAAMLAIAHGFESIGGLDPCMLCLRQREVYWAALAVGGAAVAVDRLYHRVWLCRLFCAALAVIFLVGAGVAAYHAGAEWKWWPGPDACAAVTGGVSAGDLAAALGGARVQAPRCDEAAWVFLGLSMAGWNAVASLVLAGLSAWAALQPRYMRQLPPGPIPETA